MTLRPVPEEGGSDPKPESAASILYVEDEELNWRVTERYLRAGYTLTWARDARDAFSILSTQRFDLILMDIQLSGSDLDGIQIARVLKGTNLSRPPHYAVPIPDADKIPIVFVTAYGSRYTKNSLLLVGGADVIYKPVSFIALNACLARLTQREARRKQ